MEHNGRLISSKRRYKAWVARCRSLQAHLLLGLNQYVALTKVKLTLVFIQQMRGERGSYIVFINRICFSILTAILITSVWPNFIGRTWKTYMLPDEMSPNEMSTRRTECSEDKMSLNDDKLWSVVGRSLARRVVLAPDVSTCYLQSLAVDMYDHYFG